MIEVRAKSVIKITTGKSNLDHEYNKGTPVLHIANDMIHALVQEVGTEKAKELVNEKISKYKAEYKGLGK